MLSISPIASVSPLATDIDSQAVPLSDRFTSALAETYVWAGTERDALLRTANDPMTAADPQRLYELQMRQEAYSKKVAVSSALMSHFTKGVETLLKS
ncbi:hypothetical protein [Xanthomonas sp. 60]